MVAEYQDRPVTRPVDAPKLPESAKVRDILEYRAGLDDTLPPTPLRELLSKSGANVFVLSADAELKDTIQRAGGDQYPVYSVADWAELRAAIEDGRCGIAVLDAALLGQTLARRIVELERFDNRLVTLVAADRNDAQGLIGFLSDRKIHRLLIKPPALGITRLLLESAVSRCIQLREQADSQRAAPVQGETRPQTSVAAPASAPRLPVWLLATALLSLLIGAAIVASFTPIWRGTASSDAGGISSRTQGAPRAAATGATPTGAGAATSPATDRFADLLSRADRAFSEGRLAEPSGDNALDYYLTILAVDPAHAAARERVTMILDALFARAEAGLLDNSLDSVAVTLAAVRRADPQSSRLAFLNAQLERARAAAPSGAAELRAGGAPPSGQGALASQGSLAPQGPLSAQGPRASTDGAAAVPPASGPSAVPTASGPSASATPPAAGAAATAPRGQQAELDSLLTIAAARMQRGQLVEPAGDSARDYIARAAQLSRSDPGVVRARADLAAALVTAAGVVVKAGNVGASAALLDEARKLGARSESVALVEAEVAEARLAQTEQRHAALLAAARERLSSGALVVPAGESALDQLLAAEADAPNSADLQPLWSDLTQKITANATAALAGGDPAAAENWVAALARSGRDPANAEALRRQVDTLRLRQQYLATAAPASELNLVSYPKPVYPREAQLDGTEGWVDLEFVVDANGRPRDVRAVDGQPSGRFERAAIAAVSQYQYEPFKRDGQVFERRVRLRIRFTLQ